MSRRILITGGSGFIGTNLVEHFLPGGAPLLNLDVSAPRNAAHRHLWRQADLRDRDALIREVQSFAPTEIHHLGARTDLGGRSIADYAANTDGVSNLIDAAAAVDGLKRVIFASSRLVCQIGYQPKADDDYCPTTAYGESKVTGEKLVRERAPAVRFDCVIVRPTSIWGPWFDAPYRNFFDAVRAGVYLHPRGRRIRKSFGFVGNIVHQLDRLMAAPSAAVRGKTLYVSDYEPVEVREWAEQVRAAFNAPRVREVPVSVLRTGAIAGDALKAMGWRDPPLTSFRLDNLMTEMLHDSRELAGICGPSPFTVEQGVRITADWMQSGARR